MKTVRYICSHCGRKFEAEEKEVLECPGCFWSTSVKREEDAREEARPNSAGKATEKKFALKIPAIPWKSVAVAFLLISGIFILVKAGSPLLGKLTRHRSEDLSEHSVSINKKEKGNKGKPSVSDALPANATLSGLSPEDQNILNRRVQVNVEREPSEEENNILSNKAVFKSGFSEKLPSQAWTLENFKEMIAQQEKFYQVPLPRSYKGKLQDLFETKYLAGSEAFKSGNLIQARNLWVESLAFPVYANNPEKHRGVILTMMRPFINDTLSKIGAINTASVEKSLRAKEQAVVEAYEALFALLSKKAWGEAIKSIAEFNQKLAAFSNPTQLAGGPEDYSAGIAQVDRDIQYSLRGLLTVPPPALSDLEPLRMDVLRKKRVAEGLIPENMKAMQQKYDEGMDALSHGDWAGSINILKEVDLPADLYFDAQDKIKVLKKLSKGVPAENLAAEPKKRLS